MKRLLTLMLSLNLLLTSFISPSVVSAADVSASATDGFEIKDYTYDDLMKLPAEPAFEDTFLPAGAKWLEYVGKEQPATFAKNKIKCTLADDVIRINNISQNLADMGQLLSGSSLQKLSPGRIVEKGGYISKSVLDKAASEEIKTGSVIVDEAKGTAFKVSSETEYSGIFDTDPELSKLVKPLEGTYSVTKPELHEVVKEFELQEDTVQLNKANITEFAPGVEGAVRTLSAVPLAVGDEDKKFKYLTGDNLIDLDFKDVTVLQGTVSDSTIYVELSGGVAIDAIQVTGRYSCNGGYEISMTMQQECYLVAMLDAEVHEEIRVPILGIDIPFGIGQVYGGIFAVIGMDGTVRLDIEARETSSCKMGIEGGTFLYVPTSFHPIFEPEPPKMSGDCGLDGKINGFIKFGPMLGLELFGFDLVGAGVLLGSGVNVDSDGAMMDVELYGCIDVYVDLAGKHFNLLRAKPTIYKKKQPDMHGYRVSFLEAYVNPGRVGGLIEEEPLKSGGAYLPSVGLDYRVWIIPKNKTGSFNTVEREAALSGAKADTQTPLEKKVRTYPDSGFAKTNAEGEFYQVDQDICYDGDQVWLEFVGKAKDKNGSAVNQTFFVGPVKPILPFTDITITFTDLFNDYITGKVEPKRLIKWDANRLNPDEVQTELSYYQGPIFISPFNDYGMYGNKIHPGYTVCGTARTDTNSQGEFDTRNPYLGKDGKLYDAGTIDVLETTYEPYLYYEKGVDKSGVDYPPAWVGVVASLQINEAVKNTTFYGITPGMPDFQITRTLNFVEGSYKKLTEGGRLIHQMEYDEYIWIANPTGTRAVTADMLKYVVTGFSSQDYKGYSQNPVKTTREGAVTLTPVLDDNGKPTGAALYAQRVTMQWVWQAHPNPIKITSADHTQTVAGTESTFQVKAEGFLPRYNLEGAPQRVWIDEVTGLLYIPQTLNPGKYTFTIHAREGIAINSIIGKDPKKGNDSSPPDQQTFTLTVTEKPNGTSSADPSEPPDTTTPEPPDTTIPEPDKRTAPVIYEDEYNTYLTMDGSKDLTIPFKASGSAPITWSLLSANGGNAPTGIAISASTGVLTAKKTLAPGTFTFTVKASNDVGSDLHECTLVVAAPLTAPVLQSRRDGYQFSMTARATTDFSAQIKADGSSPIVYSLEAVNARIPVPSEVSINASTGVLTAKKTLAPGTFTFAVRASNNVGSDLRECTLVVAAPLTAPVLQSRRDGYQFSMTSATTDFSVQIKADGSSPIIYSLEAVNARIPIPSEVSINASTGVLRVKGGLTGGIKSGVYEFIVKASNAAGSDTRSCKLEVTTSIIRQPVLTRSDSSRLAFVPLAAKSNGQNENIQSKTVVPDLFAGETPPNKLTIRCDDPKDVYTHDREVYNGAYFLHWDTQINITLATVRHVAYSSGTSVDGQSLAEISQLVKMNDNTPVCDRYHYYDPAAPTVPVSAEELAKIKEGMKKVINAEMAAYKNGYITVQKISTGNIVDKYSDLRVNPMDTVTTGLEYGTLVSEISSKKNGAYTVDLNTDTGTVVSGAYFTALKGSRKASLTFRQNSAEITFAGKDIKTANAQDLLNIGFTHTPHEKAMLDSIGSGYQNFAYGFQHHGDLPGVATFSLTTDIAGGTQVNVYKFDAATNQFTLIAADLTVGENGVVTYKNNTMSEYLITTKTIEGAAVSKMAGRQGDTQYNLWLTLIVIGLAASGITVAVWVFLRRKNRQRNLNNHPGSPL